MLRRGEVECRALNDHGNYIIDHGISFLNFCGNPDSARHLMLIDICMKFREYSLSGFQVIEQTPFL